jgi:hypothetical protein
MRLMAMDGINLPAKSLLGFEHQSQLEPFLRLFFAVLFSRILDMKNISQTRKEKSIWKNV